MDLLNFLNLLPLGVLGLALFIAVTRGRKRDLVHEYFIKTKYHTGRKCKNLFGVPSPNL